jgi:hypothetical protein
MKCSRARISTALALLPMADLCAQNADLDELAELRRIIAAQAETIAELAARVDELEARVGPTESEAQPEPVSVPAEPPLSADSAGSETLPDLSEAERREQERLVRAAFQRTLIDRGGLLLPPRTIDIQPSLEYLHSSAENIVIDGFTLFPVLVVGDIVSEKVDRSVSQLSTTFRFGLPWKSQLDVRIPYSYHEQQVFSADGMETTTSASGFGDMEIGFSREFARSQGPRPDFLWSLRWKAASEHGPFDIDPETELALGTGYHSLNAAFTGVKVVDPIVYFGSLSYSRNFARDETVGRFDPGDSAGISLGMAIALNLNSSLSFSYDQHFVQRARVDGLGVPGSYLTTGMFTVGGSFAVSDSLTADFSLNIGVTEDSPDLQLGVSFPVRLRR